jgi:hypothetical protein
MSRLIPEDAVIALVQGKIDAILDGLQRRYVEPGTPDHNIGLAKISALQTVISGLQWIQTA